MPSRVHDDRVMVLVRAQPPHALVLAGLLLYSLMSSTGHCLLLRPSPSSNSASVPQHSPPQRLRIPIAEQNPMSDDENPYVYLQHLHHREIFWRDKQRFLQSRGYMLRPRYRPGWQPSWEEGNRDAWMHYEDGIAAPVCHSNFNIEGYISQTIAWLYHRRNPSI